MSENNNSDSRPTEARKERTRTSKTSSTRTKSSSFPLSIAVIAALVGLGIALIVSPDAVNDLLRLPSLRSSVPVVRHLERRQESDTLPTPPPLYDPDGCTPQGIDYSPGDCGLVERYLQAGGVPLFRRNRLAMGNKEDADGHSCAVEYWEPGKEGTCCNYAPRGVDTSITPHPEIRIDCSVDRRVTGLSWGLRSGPLASHTWLYMPELEYLRIYGLPGFKESVAGPFPNWVLRHSNLKSLFVEDTAMNGAIRDLSDLYQLQTLHINNNGFDGSIPILPASLTALSLFNNNFEGEIATGSFPSKLQYCALSNNSLCFIGTSLRCGPRDEFETTTERPYGIPSCEAYSSLSLSQTRAATGLAASSTIVPVAVTRTMAPAPIQTKAGESHVATVAKTTSSAGGLLAWSMGLVGLVGGLWVAFAV